MVEYVPAAGYFQTGKTDSGLYSQRIFNNRTSLGLYYATILNKKVVGTDVSPFLNVIAPVTDDIKTVFIANDNAAGNTARKCKSAPGLSL
ncbi:hypothetical protein GCM10011396_38170 [Undibacterium terreum]|uniref:Uncharacterized protein n=1 Tax=Undibacterium terreum TaxID=1224302 RepID=A0A916UT79_9BURK|nr:hypothetical protein GCM10011396_38170 [Undibacterium terreum]